MYSKIFLAPGSSDARSYLRLVFLFDKSLCAVSLTEERLLDLAGRVSRNISKDDLLRPLVAGKLVAELHEFLDCAVAAGFDLNDRACDLAKTLVRETNDCDVLNLGIFLEEVLDLDRKSVV